MSIFYCGNSNVVFHDGSIITCEETPIEIQEKISESEGESISLSISKITEFEIKQFSKKSIKQIYWAD